MGGVMDWFHFWLLLHILFAIAVFGPTFAFPLIATFAAKEPQHAHVVVEIAHAIETRIVLPGGFVMPFLGMALILEGHFSLGGNPWLVEGIILYTIAYLFSLTVQLRNSNKMLKLLEAMPAPPSPGVAGAEGGAAPGPQGPPPAIAAQAKRLQLGGTFLLVLVLAIIVLMVWRPGCGPGFCGG
jgi:uncharacterized membrane protein